MTRLFITLDSWSLFWNEGEGEIGVGSKSGQGLGIFSSHLYHRVQNILGSHDHFYNNRSFWVSVLILVLLVTLINFNFQNYHADPLELTTNHFRPYGIAIANQSVILLHYPRLVIMSVLVAVRNFARNQMMVRSNFCISNFLVLQSTFFWYSLPSYLNLCRAFQA